MFCHRPGAVVVAASGGFDPIHPGHIDYLEGSKRLGDYLVVILNNDNWLMHKKGFVFMGQHQRARILLALRCVDTVLISQHAANHSPNHGAYSTVCAELALLRPTVFAKGGDRTVSNTPEGDVCAQLGIRVAYNVGGGKTCSSTELVRRSKDQLLTIPV